MKRMLSVAILLAASAGAAFAVESGTLHGTEAPGTPMNASPRASTMDAQSYNRHHYNRHHSAKAKHTAKKKTKPQSSTTGMGGTR
jgi:hypothetical protein